MGPLIVLGLRLLVPITILKWPLWGGVAALLLDLHDENIIKLFGAGYSPALDHLFSFKYQEVDKALDMYYLSLEFIVSLKWRENLARVTSVWLFLWRLVGFILFEVTRVRAILVFTPNIFENFFLFHLITKRYFPKFTLTAKNLPFVLVLLGIPKLYQEYMLHIQDARPYAEFKHALLRFLKEHRP